MSQQQTVSEKIKGQNNQNQKVQQQATQTKDKVELAFEKPQEFSSQHAIKVTTTMALCKLVNALFRAIPDYEGCIIAPDANGILQCSLYFHLSPKQTEQSVVVSADSLVSNNDIMAKYNRMSARSQNRKLSLTDFGKTILFDYIYKGNVKEINKVNWNQITVEQIDQQQYGQGIPLLKVNCIDLLKVIPKFYSNPDKKFYQWNLQIMRPIGIANVGTPNFLVTIARIDCKEVEQLASEMGFLTSTGSLPIVR